MLQRGWSCVSVAPWSGVALSRCDKVLTGFPGVTPERRSVNGSTSPAWSIARAGWLRFQ